jgi:hypothetical protein
VFCALAIENLDWAAVPSFETLPFIFTDASEVPQLVQLAHTRFAGILSDLLELYRVPDFTEAGVAHSSGERAAATAHLCFFNRERAGRSGSEFFVQNSFELEVRGSVVFVLTSERLNFRSALHCDCTVTDSPSSSSQAQSALFAAASWSSVLPIPHVKWKASPCVGYEPRFGWRAGSTAAHLPSAHCPRRPARETSAQLVGDASKLSEKV